MRLDINDVILYLDCPMKYVNHKENPELSLDDEFDICIHKTIYAYYYSIMNGKRMTLNDIRKKWGSLWYKDMTKEEIMFSNSNSIRSEMGMRGAHIIGNFYDNAISLPILPITVEQEYCIKINNHYLSGHIELIYETRKENRRRSIDLVSFRTDDEVPDNFVIKYDLATTAQSYAFREIFDAKENRIILDYLKKNKSYPTSRGKREFNSFKTVIDNVANSISSGFFYPKYSINCKGCPYQKRCKFL